MTSKALTSLLTCLLLLTASATSACAAPPAAAPTDNSTEKPLQVRGFSMQLNDPKGMATYLKAIDDMADMGCTWVNFCIAARQDNVKSATLHINWSNLPAPPDLEIIMKHARKRHMHTILMPIVLLDHSGTKDWRGVIDPPDWDNWFFSYEMYMKQAARMAARCDVDIFCVGSELLSTEAKRDNWIKTIEAIREIYKGKLTYSANWDHYTVPSFWDQLDYIGMNNYNELAKEPGASVAELVKKWKPIKEQILAFVAKQHKPFLFTEVGWHNLQNTIAEPWNYVAEGPIDHTEQLHAFKSFIEVWQNVGTDQFMGALVWEWRPGAKATDHGTYSLQGSPAMEVVRKWMAGK